MRKNVKKTVKKANDRRFGIVLLATLVFGAAEAQNLVPKPVTVERGGGVVTLIPYRNIETTHAELAPLADYLAGYLPAGRVRLTFDGAEGLPAEGYRLEVSPERISIAGRDYGGVWNGIQTLLQLFPAEIYKRDGLDGGPGGDGAGSGGGFGGGLWTLPEVVIEDRPAMEHRGVMLDVARTFVPKEEVMRLIDNISHHKINKLHWHLADDEGWRIEIKSLPRLTEVGAWRGGDSPVFAVYGAWDTKYGGFYTQDEIREVVAYAALRNVEVIPEIDLPGHSRAAAIAYPEILCGYKPSLTASAGYDTRNVWCVAREENYAMLDAIIGEVAALFPSPVFHLGGDEVSVSQWRQCPHCKALMAERGITDVARLQDIFMEQVIEIAARHGKRAAVWNEAAVGGTIPRTTTVWGWENIAAARRAAADGYPTVVCAGEYFYFDMRQSARDIGHIWAGIVTLEKVYSFSPAAVGFTEAEAASVRGVEATLFGELMLENSGENYYDVGGYIDHQFFPRVCALAEVAWTPATARSWEDFEGRLRGDPRSGGLDSGSAGSVNGLGSGAAGGLGSGLGSAGSGVVAGAATSHFDRLAAMGIAYRASEPVAPVEGKLLKPAVTFTSSLTESARYPFGGVSSYRTAARTTAACVEGDRFVWKFDEPVAASRIEIRTGHNHLQRCGIPRGRVEVSYDGVVFERVAEMRDLKATVVPTMGRRVHAIRIISESHGNGESFVIIQPLKIR